MNVEVTSLSVNMRDAFASGLAYLAWGVGAAAAGRLVRRERMAEQSLARTALLLGELPATVRAYSVARAATIVAVVHGLTWTLVVKLLVRPDATRTAVVEAAMIAVTLIATLWAGADGSSQDADDGAPRRMALRGSVVDVLTQWRHVQIMRRSRIARLVLALAAGMLLLLPFVAARAAPPFVGFIISLAAGYIMALTLVFQLADDLPNAWTERGLGVTHDQFIGAYERLGLGLGAAFGLVGAALYALGKMLGPGLTPAALNEALKVLVVVALPAIVTPWLLFQIDGRRAGVGAILVLIATLFLSTAVYAHWLSLFLLLLLRYYALSAQAGRFYRA